MGAVIDIPRGSRNRIEYNYQRGILRLDRVFYASVHYATDYGFAGFAVYRAACSGIWRVPDIGARPARDVREMSADSIVHLGDARAYVI